jgi:hypothetical protein
MRRRECEYQVDEPVHLALIKGNELLPEFVDWLDGLCGHSEVHERALGREVLAVVG